MAEIKPHIQQWKKDEVKDIIRLFNEYPVAGVIDLQNLPALQFMKIRRQLKDKMYAKVTKKRLIIKALEQLKDKKNIDNLKQHLKGIPSLIFTKEDPFILYKQINKSKSNVAAKPGQVAPDDIKVEAGPTPFTPGPIIGELGRLGLKTEVKEGKINLKEGKVIVKAGEVISAQVADLLTKLGIEPMAIGLNLVAAYEKEKGEILDKTILTVDEKEYVGNLKQIVTFATNLAAFIEYGDPEILKLVVKKAYLSGKAVADKAKIEIKEDEKVELTQRKEQPKEIKVEKPVEKPKEAKPEAKVEKPKEPPKVEIKVEPKVEKKEVKVEPKIEEKKVEVKPVETKIEKPIVKVEEKKVATTVEVKPSENKAVIKQEVKPDDVKVAQDVLRKLQDVKLSNVPKTSGVARPKAIPKGKSVTDIINELKDKKSRGEI